MTKEVKKEKKKLIRVRMAPALIKANPYRSSITDHNLHFSLVGPQVLKKDDIQFRHQISKFVTCREELCCMPRQYINKTSKYVASEKEDHLDLEKFRLLMASKGNKEVRKRGIFSAKRVLNILEEKAGWEKSVITTVIYEPAKDANVYLLTGDKRWTMAPQMMSLATLIIRIGWKGLGFSSENIEEVQTEFAKISEDEEENDNRYMKSCQKYIIPLMANVEKVFSGEINQYFPEDADFGFRGHGGIYTFFTERSGNEKLDERLTKYVK